MKTTLTLACVLSVMGASSIKAQRLRLDDPNYKELYQVAGNNIGWYQISSTKAWAVTDGAADGLKGAQCMAAFEKLRAAGVPDSRTVEVSYDTPEFKQGPHTIGEIRASCEHLDRLGKIKYFERWAVFAMQDTPKLASGNYETKYFKNCLQAYDEVIKAGISPGERVPERVIGNTTWSGTIEELRDKWCAPGLAKAHEKTAEHEAPYRQALRNDKLKIALVYESFFLTGGASTGDPQKLAAAPVWFSEFLPSKVCTDGRPIQPMGVRSTRSAAINSAPITS